jgi:O-antigen ligase
VFWLGLLLLGYVALQASNPVWAYITDGKYFWMMRIPGADWLPPGVRVPFEKWGPWRSFMVFGGAWLTVCAIWIGFTRRRTLQILVGALAANGLLVALLGVAQRMTRTNQIYWSADFPGAMTFASFVYKNHGAEYLLLVLASACALAGWFYLRGLRRMEKSNPSGVLAFGAMFIAVAIVTSYARGATLTMLTYLLACIIGFVVHQLSLRKEHRRTPILVVMVFVFGYFLNTGLEALQAGEAWERIKSGVTRQDLSWESREWAGAATWEMIKDRPLTGAGAGSFEYVFPLYQQRDKRLGSGTMFWQQAHNDLLQFPAELGVIGCGLILAMLGWWFVPLIRSRFWKNPFSVCLTSGLIALLVYSWFDFPFQCPAVLVTWCALWPVVTLWTQLEEQRGG